MENIQTFRGPKPLSQYHKICAHEHLLIDLTHEAVTPQSEEDKALFYSPVTMERLGVLRRNPYIIRDNLILDNADDAINELKPLKKHGVDLFLDLTSIGIKRNIQKLIYISQNTDIDLVIGTGFFVHDSLDEASSKLSTEEMADFMLREIREGIDGTGIRAGVIGEVGVSEKIYKETGLPIYLHTYPWSWAGLEAAKLLVSEGVEPRYICICHIDVTFDYEYLMALLELGVYIEFDNMGKEFYFPPQEGSFAGGPFATDVERVRMLQKLIDAGYCKQLIIANDICLKAGLRKYGGWGYDHIFENIVPMMQQEKMAAEDIRQIVEVNPLNFLKGMPL